SLRSQMEQGKLKLIHSLKDHIRIDEYMKDRLVSFREAIVADGSAGGDRLPWLKQKVEQGLTQLYNHPTALAQLDETIKSALMNWIEQKHALIGQTVQDKLSLFSEEELIELVKEKAGQDLQYIRLNGIVAGALIGAMLYLLTFWI